MKTNSDAKFLKVLVNSMQTEILLTTENFKYLNITVCSWFKQNCLTYMHKIALPIDGLSFIG